jgi:hypothetical protein
MSHVGVATQLAAGGGEAEEEHPAVGENVLVCRVVDVRLYDPSVNVSGDLLERLYYVVDVADVKRTIELRVPFIRFEQFFGLILFPVSSPADC